jgi:spore maturation protein CgeB
MTKKEGKDLLKLISKYGSAREYAAEVAQICIEEIGNADEECSKLWEEVKNKINDIAKIDTGNTQHLKDIRNGKCDSDGVYY